MTDCDSPNSRDPPRAARQVCNHVTRQMGVCYSMLTPACGNGVLEPGEECDDNSGCCDPKTCKLRAGAMCTPGLDRTCCTADCKVVPTYVGCDIPGGPETGYCFNGMCRFSRLAAAYSNLQGCPAPAANPCKEYVQYANDVACKYTDASFGLQSESACIWLVVSVSYHSRSGIFCVRLPRLPSSV